MKKHTAITWPLFILLLIYAAIRGIIVYNYYSYWNTYNFLLAFDEAMMLLAIIFIGFGLIRLSIGSWILGKAIVMIVSCITTTVLPNLILINVIPLIGLAILYTQKRWSIIIALITQFILIVYYAIYDLGSVIPMLTYGIDEMRFYIDSYVLFLGNFLNIFLEFIISIFMIFIFKEIKIDKPTSIDRVYRDSLGLNFLYTILSFGFYGMVWLGHLLHNIQVLTGRKFAVTWHLLGYMLVPYYSIYVIYLAQSQLKNYSQYLVTTYQNLTLQLPIGTPGIVVASALGWNIISLPLIQNNMDHLLGYVKPQAS